MNPRIYFDHNGTTPLAPEVAAAMQPFLEERFGNPSSTHWAGAPAREAVERARGEVASLLCCDATEVVFTSGGTEANNHALLGVFFAATGKRLHYITSQVEHPAVLEPCRFLEQLGAEVTRLPVDRYGLIDPDDVRRAIRPNTVLVSVMHANNEVGTIQPIEDIAHIARQHGVLCHTDAAQTVGKIPVDCDALGVDLLTVAGHKLYGPKGIGALIVREGVRLAPFMHGAGQEAGRRGGTENVLEIVGLGAACTVAQRELEHSQVSQLRDYFWQRLSDQFGDTIQRNGHPERQLPNTLHVSFLGAVGQDILAQVPELAASTGAACHAGHTTLSPVLRALGVDEAEGRGAIRFSLGRNNTRDEVDHVVERLASVVRATSTPHNF